MISSDGFFVKRLTATVMITENIIQITPIIGEHPTPDLIAVPSEQEKSFE